MTPEPFEDFADYGDAVVSRKPSVENLLVAIGEIIPTYYQWVQRLPAEVRSGYLRQALADLAGLSAGEVQSAARSLLDRGLPTAKELVPTAIRHIVAKSRIAHIDQIVGQRTVQCPLCKDAGTLTVYGRKTIQLWQEKKLPGPYGPQFEVRCTCPAGQKWQACEILQTYNPAEHLPCLPYQTIPEALKAYEDAKRQPFLSGS